MKVGIDIGSTNTKIVIVNKDKIVKKIILESSHSTNYEELLERYKISKINITGGNKTRYPKKILGIKTNIVDEIKAMIKGAGKNFVSMGTGTCIVKAGKHIGGTSIGGGTYVGLSKLLLKTNNYETLESLASKGTLRSIDLTVGEIKGEGVGLLNKSVTASNFAKANMNKKEDLALGIQNLIAESIFSTMYFALQGKKIKIIGKLIDVKHIKKRMIELSKKFGLEIEIPKNAAFIGAYGAALM